METIDPSDVLRVLGVSVKARCTPVSGGADARIWRVEHGGSTWALRLLRSGQMAQAERESIAIAHASAGGIPTPPVVAFGTWKRRPVLLLSWASGQPLAKALLESRGEAGRVHALGASFGRTQAAIHALPPPEDLTTDWLEWAKPEPALRKHLAMIESKPPALLHLDYHPLNVLMGGEQVTAVLDWANARIGDPRADIARTFSILQLTPFPAEVPRAEAAMIRRGFELAWRQGYQEAGGSFHDLAPFCWWAGAAMEHDLAPRVDQTEFPWITSAYLGRVRQ